MKRNFINLTFYPTLGYKDIELVKIESKHSKNIISKIEQELRTFSVTYKTLHELKELFPFFSFSFETIFPLNLFHAIKVKIKYKKKKSLLKKLKKINDFCELLEDRHNIKISKDLIFLNEKDEKISKDSLVSHFAFLIQEPVTIDIGFGHTKYFLADESYHLNSYKKLFESLSSVRKNLNEMPIKIHSKFRLSKDNLELLEKKNHAKSVHVNNFQKLNKNLIIYGGRK